MMSFIGKMSKDQLIRFIVFREEEFTQTSFVNAITTQFTNEPTFVVR